MGPPMSIFETSGPRLRLFKKAIELKPEYDEAYMNLGLVTFYDCNDPAKAWEYMMKAIEIDPNYALAYRYLGEFSEDQNPEEAQRWFEKSIEIDPNQPETQFKLAMLVKDKKDVPRAKSISSGGQSKSIQTMGRLTSSWRFCYRRVIG